MFSKNGKFKLYFWSIMLVATLGCGIFGAIKNYKDTEEERKLAKLSQKTSDKIIIEGNLASKTDEVEITNLVTAILNDAHSELTKSNNEMTLSDKGKLITAVKYMYLEDKINFTDGLDDDDIEEIVKMTLELFGNYVKFQNDFSINYSSSFCGSTGYDNTLAKSYGLDSIDDTQSCESPVFLFEVDKIRYDKDTYVALVHGIYAEETNNNSLVGTESEQVCAEGSTEFYRTVKLHSDKNISTNLYKTDITGCCNSSKCTTAGITKIKSSLLSTAISNNYNYYLRFNKNENGYFELAKIEYTK